jgi:threonine/homoserine/homoserine lactone efflux protein
MSLKLILLFAVTEILVSLTPGPAVFLIISQGIKRGFKASLGGTLGIEICNGIYFALSALGLGAVLVASANLFQLIRWLGVAYLVVIGLKMLLITPRTIELDAPAVTTRNSLTFVAQGFITQVINPKAILYFTALLPQFISPAQPMMRQFLMLGMISMLVEVPVLAIYGWFAAQSGVMIPKKFSSLSDRVAGAFLIGAGAGLAAIRKP